MKDDTTRAEVREALLKYLDTDTIWCVFIPFSKYLAECSPSFFHNNPEPLERLQTKHWVPLLDWARTNFNVQLNVSASILSAAQPTATREKFRKVIESFDQWEMAGLSNSFQDLKRLFIKEFIAMERATYGSKSLIIALALIKNHLTVEEAALASTVEVNSQIERWGEMEDSECNSLISNLNNSVILCGVAHRVDYHDVRRQLGSAACLLSSVWVVWCYKQCQLLLLEAETFAPINHH